MRDLKPRFVVAYAASRHRPPASWLPPSALNSHCSGPASTPIRAAHADLVSLPLVPDEIHPSAADAGDGADNAANGVGDVVVGAGRMVDAVAAGARDPPLQADDLGDG